MAGRDTYRWIPHTETKLANFMLLQHDGSWPIPSLHKIEELCEDGGTACHGVELADAGYHDSPCDATWIAKDCAVDRAAV